jgi:hypothetical protein
MRLMRTIAAMAIGSAILLGVRTVAAQPEPELFYPEDGADVQAPPPILQICFAEPINILDLDKGGDFKFSVRTPEDQGLGLRIVFQPDGLGVGVHPGYPTPAPEGEWTFEWRVTEPETLEPATGTIRFTVSPDGSPLPNKPPAPCGGTPFPDATDTPTNRAGDGDDGGLDTVMVIIIAIAALAGTAVLALVVSRLRRRA